MNSGHEKRTDLTSDTLSVMLDFISIHAHLVTSDDSIQAVLLAKLGGDIWSELHSDTSLARSATWFVLRVSPKHLHHETSLTRLSLVMPVQLANVIQGDAVVGEQSTVENQVLLANQCRQGQCRKALGEQLERSVE